jgi:hypothetical protein
MEHERRCNRWREAEHGPEESKAAIITRASRGIGADLVAGYREAGLGPVLLAGDSTEYSFLQRGGRVD